jgi:hypothetical protein
MSDKFILIFFQLFNFIKYIVFLYINIILYKYHKISYNILFEYLNLISHGNFL